MCDNEFKAIILAGGSGSRMREITNKKPKCLIPIGNLPLIWYPLSLLERSGFNNVVIIVLDEEHSEIKKAIEKLGLKITPKYVSIKQDDDLGTADSLRKVPKTGEDKDVLVISCDLITDIPLENLLNMYRKYEASFAGLFFPSVPDPVPGTIPGPKSKQKPERDLVGLDPITSRLLMLASASDFEETLDIRMRMLRKHHRMELHSKLTDAHLYIINKHLWKFITNEDNGDSTLKGEVLPFIIRQQMSKLNNYKEDNGGDENEEDDDDTEFEGKVSLFKCIPQDNLQQLIEEISTWSDHPGCKDNSYHGDRLRCYAYVAKQPIYASRINTLATYWDINRQIIKSDQWNNLNKNKNLIRVEASPNIKSKKIDMSIIANGCKIEEGVKIEKSTLGNNCKIEKGAIIIDCTLMDNVFIGENVNLTNCLVCEHGVIEKNSTLKSCLIGYNYKVFDSSVHENEILSGIIMET